MVVHQNTVMVVAFELVGDIDKFDEDTLQVVGRVREIEEEENEEDSEEEENEEDSEEEDEDEDEACSEYVSPFWEELKGMFLPIQHSLGQLRQNGMDTRTYKESFGILTYTIWSLEQKEMKAGTEVMEEWYEEVKEKLGSFLVRLDGFLAKLIRPWKDRLQLMKELASFDRANYQVVYRSMIEEKNPHDSPSASSNYPANYKKRVVSTHRDFPIGCGPVNSSVKASVEEEDEDDPSEDEALDGADA